MLPSDYFSRAHKRCIGSFGNCLGSPAWVNSTMCSGVGSQFIEGLAWSLWEAWTMKSARCSPGRSKGCNTYTMTSAPYPQSLANKLKSELANGRGEVRLRVKDCKDWTKGYPRAFRYVFRGRVLIFNYWRINVPKRCSCSRINCGTLSQSREKKEIDTKQWPVSSFYSYPWQVPDSLE